MRAVLSNSAIDEYNVEIGEIEVPEPGPGQVQVRVAAAVVNPVDQVVASPGVLRSLGMAELPEQLGLGWDLAGTVSAVGGDVSTYQVGQRVIGLVDKFVTPIGAQAERRGPARRTRSRRCLTTPTCGSRRSACMPTPMILLRWSPTGATV